MAEINTLPSGSPTAADLLDNYKRYIYNPSAIQRASFSFIEEITSGRVNFVDPTNPVVLTLEMMAVQTAALASEAVSELRRLYPSLAMTQDDLYSHMCDGDYIGRFSTPASTSITVAVLANDVINKMVYDETEGCHKVVIPRDTSLSVDTYVFTMQYPVVIRKFASGQIQISYDSSITSPLVGLTTNIITPEVRYDTSQVAWIFFKVAVMQYGISSKFFALEKSKYLSESLSYTDTFYYARVFYRNTASSKIWTEIKTTHSDLVFDPYTPTALLKVYDGYLGVEIPPIYLNTGQISGEVRVDVYTTKGEVTINMANYQLSSFKLDFKAIDQVRDQTPFTTALSSMSFYAYAADIVSGGSTGKTFDTLRNQVIENATGAQQIPIMSKTINPSIGSTGFSLVKNIDTVTNVAFLATRNLPKPTNTKLLTAAVVGCASVSLIPGQLTGSKCARVNGSRITVFSNNLFRQKNSITERLGDTEVNTILSLNNADMVETLNSGEYYYNPFYYVLDDSTEEFTVRPYHMDSPQANGLSFESNNETLRLQINTGSFKFEKTPDGYRLTLVTSSGAFYKQLEDSEVQCQLAYTPSGETSLAYLTGVFDGRTTTQERIFVFDITTNYDIDSSSDLCLTGFGMNSTTPVETWVALSTKFHIFHTTTSIEEGFVANADDALIGRAQLKKNSVLATHETLKLVFGYSLDYLWCRSRTYAAGQTYRKYTEDIPLRYETDGFDLDPVTGSIFKYNDQGGLQLDAQGRPVYVKTHTSGDIVRDELGEIVYQHRVGDLVLDRYGKPIVDASLGAAKDVDLLLVDAKYFFE